MESGCAAVKFTGTEKLLALSTSNLRSSWKNWSAWCPKHRGFIQRVGFLPATGLKSKRKLRYSWRNIFYIKSCI